MINFKSEEQRLFTKNKLIYSAGTEIGKIRKVNEDAYLAEKNFFAVADGMGGHLAGEIASNISIKFLQKKFKKRSQLAKLKEDLKNSFQEANSKIYQEANRSSEKKGMGTTLSAVFLQANNAIIAHVGDSRVYLFRHNKLHQLTEDHTLVADLIKEGLLREEEARTHPQRSVITRALGVNPNIDVEIIEKEINDEDVLILCTDGISSQISNEVIKEVILKSNHPEEMVKQLLVQANQAGGKDNATAIVIKILKVKSESENKNIIVKIFEKIKGR